MADIHPMAVIEDGATLADSVSIGPFCVVGPHVTLDSNVVLMSHVVVDSKTRIGEGTRVYPHAVIGMHPQDLRHKGELTEISIGKNNLIREHATIHPGTSSSHGITTVGDNCMFMVNTHIAHDCSIGNHVIMANNAAMGGHVVIQDHVIVGGNAAIQQFVRVGKHAMLGGLSGTEADVIPYGSVVGQRAGLAGLNLIGLRRRGFSREEIHTLRRAYRLLFAQEGTLTERVNDVADMFSDSDPVMDIINFIKVDASRPICQPSVAGVS